MNRFISLSCAVFVFLFLGCAGQAVRDSDIQTNETGDLWVLSIGVDRYVNNTPNTGYLDLRNPSSDARKIIDTFKAQEGKRYDRVHALCVSDNEPVQPAKQAILANIEFLKQAGPNDTVLLFMSGHGKAEEGAYYFLPRDTVFLDGGRFVRTSAINTDELAGALNDIPGRRILLFDTEGADMIINSPMAQALKNRNTAIFAASNDDEHAYENLLFGGFFCFAFIEGISGRAAKNGVVELSALGEYITDRVGELSMDRQHPMRYIPDGYRDFVIGVVE